MYTYNALCPEKINPHDHLVINIQQVIKLVFALAIYWRQVYEILFSFVQI